jgi:cytochrome c peroxidase
MRIVTALTLSLLGVACGAANGDTSQDGSSDAGMVEADGLDAAGPTGSRDAASDRDLEEEEGGDAAAPSEQRDEVTALRALLHVPERMQLPLIPSVNPPSAAKVELGRHLFYDEKLSYNGTTSCATCHDQKLGFADGRARPEGASGVTLPRNSPGLQNVAYLASLTWASRSLIHLEEQLRVPILGDNPIELGVSDSNRDEVLVRFAVDEDYTRRFAAAYPDSSSGPTIEKIVFALATFVRTMNGADSPFDRYREGDSTALTEQQKQGFALFQGEDLECFHCHTGVNQTVSYADARTTLDTASYPHFNNGLYNVADGGGYPPGDEGLYRDTLNPAHRGMFRPAPLRNIALTAPYMHDGSKATLDDVLRHYAGGGTLTTSGPNAGDGRRNPLKSNLVNGFVLSDDERAALLAFFEALTDPVFITRDDLSSPF